MILSKLWFILVALTASVALTIAFVAPRSAGRQLGVTEAVGLDRAQYAVTSSDLPTGHLEVAHAGQTDPVSPAPPLETSRRRGDTL